MFKSLIKFYANDGLSKYLFHAHVGTKQVYLTLERGKIHPVLRTNGVRAYDHLTFPVGKTLKSVTIRDFDNAQAVENAFTLFVSGVLPQSAQ